MPISIPAEVLPVLGSLGIVDAANVRWRRAEPWPLRRARAHAYCDCLQPPAPAVHTASPGPSSKRDHPAPPGVPQNATRVELIFTWLANRRVFIGQCPHCRAITWRDAISEEM